MAKVLLGVTGSVAALKTPDLFAALRRAGHEVKIVATQSATYFFDPAGIEPRNGVRNSSVVSLDEDEWPGRLYQRTDKVLHIELRRWADVLVTAPLDANTLAKFANGLCDNCLTCVWRAWEPARPVILAPAMNTLMWEHSLTARHLRALAVDASSDLPDTDLTLHELVDWINVHCPRLKIVGPQSKRLACDDIGMGAMADVDAIVAATGNLSASSPIKASCVP